MRKLAALVDFIIKQLNYVAAENIDSFHVIETYKPSGEYVFNEQHGRAVCLYDQVYLAVIQIERFPGKKYPPAVVFGLVSVWLLENDPESHRYKIESDANNELLPLDNPDINTEEDDNDTLAIELIIPFREPVFGIEDDNGIFNLGGKKYRLANESLPEEQFEQHYIRNRS
jgi:P2 phage tail completion protein R (GpR)